MEKISINEKKNKKYIIMCIILIAISFFYFVYKIENSNYLLYKDQQTGEILIDVFAKKILYIVLFLMCAFSFISFIILRKWQEKKEIKVEKVFLVISLIFCILFMFAMPMSKGHDETIHAMRIYEYAEGKIESNGKTAFLEEGVAKAIDSKPRYSDITNNFDKYSTNLC